MFFIFGIRTYPDCYFECLRCLSLCVNREVCQWVFKLPTVDNTCSPGVTETLSRCLWVKRGGEMLEHDCHAWLAASRHWAQWEASACNNICTRIEFQLGPCTVHKKAPLSLARSNVDLVFKQPGWNQLLFPNIISLRVYVLCVCLFLSSSPSLTYFQILCQVKVEPFLNLPGGPQQGWTKLIKTSATNGLYRPSLLLASILVILTNFIAFFCEILFVNCQNLFISKLSYLILFV